MIVIPAINCHREDVGCVKATLETSGGFLKKDGWVHLDVADGIFTFNKTWGDRKAWANMRVPFNTEVHLMVEHPENYVQPWVAAGAKRLIVHAETITPESLKEILKFAGTRAEVMISSNPETSTEILEPYIDTVSAFQVLAVHPGLAGQKFLSLTLEKIKFLRREMPNAKIEVDGGMNLETGKLAKAAGADILVAASYIFDSDDPKKAYESLRAI